VDSEWEEDGGSDAESASSNDNSVADEVALLFQHALFPQPQGPTGGGLQLGRGSVDAAHNLHLL
jgi:hypothetical protein